jgi:hypothetical protein
MTSVLQSMVAATYVRDIDTPRTFYELLGFHERSAGKAATSAWSSRRLVQARGETTGDCQVGDTQGTQCLKRAEVKLADSRGDTVWACLGHADEILVAVPGAFLASQEDQSPGIAQFLRSRHG